MLACPLSTAQGADKSRHKFKNLPTIAPTAEGTWSSALELNLFQGAGLANATVDYGASNGWNGGLSLLNVGFWQSPGRVAWDPDILVNLERAIPITRRWTALIGTQNGAAFWDRARKSRVESFSYLDNQILWERYGVSVHLGFYIASEAMTGPGDRIGYLAGLGLPLGDERYRLVLEYISGNNALGVATAQLIWNLTPDWHLDIGAQIPAPGSPNDYGALLGIGWH